MTEALKKSIGGLILGAILGVLIGKVVFPTGQSYHCHAEPNGKTTCRKVSDEEAKRLVASW